MAAIDGSLPEWDVTEVHRTELAVASEQAMAAALSIPGAPDPIVRVLLRLRGLPHGGTIEELLRGIGLRPLARTADEIVFGAAGTPWRLGESLRTFEDATPGPVWTVASFRVEALPDGRTRLSTETRIRAVDEGARRAFRRYGRLIGPFSALIRRRWLAAVRPSLASAA